MQSDQRSAIRLGHRVKLLADDVYGGRLHWVWVPKIDHIDDELRIDVLEKVVAMVVLVHVAFDIGSLLHDQVCARRRRLRTVYLRLADKLATRSGHFSNLDRFAVVHADVAFRLPMVLILVKTVEVTRGIVQKHA